MLNFIIAAPYYPIFLYCYGDGNIFLFIFSLEVHAYVNTTVNISEKRSKNLESFWTVGHLIGTGLVNKMKFFLNFDQ